MQAPDGADITAPALIVLHKDDVDPKARQRVLIIGLRERAAVVGKHAGGDDLDTVQACHRSHIHTSPT